MFSIGIAPPRIKRKKIPQLRYSVSPVIKFVGRPTSWLILPQTNLNFFQKQFDLCSNDSFDQAYNYVKYFSLRYPPNSLGYVMGVSAFKAAEQSYEQLSQSIEALYDKNMKIRWAMKRLLNIWKNRSVRVINDTDVATQEVPKRPVISIDWRTKTAYQFEASTILQDSINRLLNNDHLFLKALPPRNPFTNSALTYGQLLSIHNQLRKNGKTNWIWESFAASNFNLLKFETTYEVPLKLRCLDILLADYKSIITVDFILDFIIGEYGYHVLYRTPNESTLMRVIVTKWENPKIQEWVRLCREYWKNNIRSRHDHNMRIHIQSEILIRSIKSWFNLV